MTLTKLNHLMTRKSNFKTLVLKGRRGKPSVCKASPLLTQIREAKLHFNPNKQKFKINHTQNYIHNLTWRELLGARDSRACLKLSNETN